MKIAGIASRLEFRQIRIGVVLMAFVLSMVVGISPVGGPNNAYLMFLAAAGTGMFPVLAMALPLLATWVAGDTIALEKRSRFNTFALTRTSRVDYAWRKLALAHILTAGVFVVGGLVCLGILMLGFPHAAPILTTAYPPFLHDLLAAHPFRYVLVVMAIMTLSAVAWSTLSLVLSLITKNIFLVLGGPWLIFMLSSVVLQAMNMTEYSPVMWSGGLVELTTRAHSNPMVIPLILLAMIIVGDAIVVATYSRGSDVLE